LFCATSIGGLVNSPPAAAARACAIGVIYRPETELASHYFQAILPQQFDEYIWLDHTKAVTPFDTKTIEEMPDTYPFGL
jgi:hypothetical protein